MNNCIPAAMGWVFRTGARLLMAVLIAPLNLSAQTGVTPATAPAPMITWDAATLRLVERGGDYGRLVRLPDGHIACVYDRAGKMWIRHSTDDGASWKEPILVAGEPDCWLTNADLLPLKDGTLLYFWDERPMSALPKRRKPASPGAPTRPFLIRMARSADLGRTWSKPQTLYTAGVLFRDGCWEPAGLQLPSGEVQVYFANEAPFTESDEQEIALLRSQDGGKSWSQAERIAMRKGHRDGMPAPLLLADGRGIAVAIEDNGYAGERFKPVVVQTTMSNNWRSGAVDGASPRRWGALREPLEPGWYAGAPCLRQLPSGATLLSFQESSDGTLGHCRMAVCVGSPDARRFTDKTYPLPQDPGGNQLWNSLFVKHADTVTAVSSATVNGVRGIWIIDGRIRQGPAATREVPR